MLTEEVDSPGERLSSWFAISGIPFVFGLFLVVAGALISRRAIASSEPEGAGDSEGRPIDFGVMLGELVEELNTMATEAGEEVSPEALETTKTEIERLRRERVERLVGARISVERRHGLACYASIFGPFSRGERQLNRAWAAIVDNHGPEAAASIARASQAFAEALAEVPR